MLAFIEALLYSASADFLTDVICFVIVIVFGVAVYLARNNKAQEFIQYTPTLLTTIGIFGTFLGIVVGLLNFDQNDIQNSIPPLLSGLKTSFITSLAGMFGSLVFKTLTTTPWLRPASVAEEVSDASPEKILAAMQEQVKETQTLREAIAGNEESTLFGQMKILRGDINDNAKLAQTNAKERFDAQRAEFDEFSSKLWIKLQDFADTLSKSATEQVIEALKQVITDFNNNLTEQFGDNFKQLNEAVKELVTWQENYKTQLEQMHVQYAQGVEAITQTEASVAHISEQSQVIPQAMGDLKEVMTVNQHQLAELERHLETFKEMRDKAVEAVPEIRRQVEATVNDITQAVTTANEHYKQLLTDSDAYIKQHAQTSEELLDKFANCTTDSIKKVGDTIEHSVNHFTDNSTLVNQSLQNSSDYLQSRADKLMEQLDEAVVDVNNNVRDMVERLVADAKVINTTMTEANNNLVADTKTVRDQVMQSTEALQSQLKDVIESVASEHRKQVEATCRDMERQIAQQVAKTAETVEGQVGVLDQALQQEINNAFKDMGGHLVRLTGRFTEDYRQLTEQMQAVVKRASNF